VVHGVIACVFMLLLIILMMCVVLLLQNGVLSVAPGGVVRNTQGLVELRCGTAERLVNLQR
jgi:hypothetical protein